MSDSVAYSNISIATARLMTDCLRRGTNMRVIIRSLRKTRVSKEALAYSGLRFQLTWCCDHPKLGRKVQKLLKRFKAILEKKEDKINESIEEQWSHKNEETSDVEAEKEQEKENDTSVASWKSLFGGSSEEKNPLKSAHEKMKFSATKKKKIPMVQKGKVLKRYSPLKELQSKADQADKKETNKISKLFTSDELF